MTLVERFIVDSILASLAYLTVMAAAAVAAAFQHGGRREETVDDPKTLSVSRFTVPVSLLVPVDESSSAAGIAQTLSALLDLDYPELEVIVLAEALPPSIWDTLKSAWHLEAKEFFFRQTLATAGVRKIYRSARDQRLMVVDKTPGGRADTLNCGVNLARFQYVSAIDLGITFEEDALLRAMAAPLRDPAAVAAISCHLETADGADAPGLQPTLQRLASIRAVMDSRLTWRTLEAGFAPGNSVIVWRRDAVVHSGGFSDRAADPDLDMMVRLHAAATVGIGGRVVRSAEIFGHVGPRAFTERVAEVARRQRAALHAVWAWRQMASPGRRALLYFAAAEILTPLLQVWVLAATVVGAVFGWLHWRDMALALVLLSFGNAIVSAAALLVRGSAHGTPDEQALRRLLLAAPLDVVASGAAEVVARTRGACAFITDLQAGAVWKR